ncbi:adenylyltransferase and sulfurtransferase MOCS3 isoform X1 [Schistocerca serialis cubense]|uniref:adenylyltransferase and sulfurtransferase MOCS3 isoform X1 n=2 Tax=Schistocerca TaxID=7008 RepID=UPI00214F0DE3|nr:adenylyltransferase and sulfurtransferase MOCS3 isoform X1 [Schistocerca serialis cubense]
MRGCCQDMDPGSLRAEIEELKKQLYQKEKQLNLLEQNVQLEEMVKNFEGTKLSNEEIGRFSRQIIVPGIGVKGQLALKTSSVLIVGAGGLGCPSALYLAGAGVGHIGIIDYDEVELNNLHRQLLHSEASLGTPKVESAVEALKRLNSGVQVTPYHIQLDSQNALEIVKKYDIVVDATDNVATRYLLNDACVKAGRPLVSGSALQFEGQLTVYNYEDGPCYRCLFPVPPPPETVTNCGDGGVLGAVPGAIGVLQALEAIKIILKIPGVLSQRLLLFDGSSGIFRNVRLRKKNPDCDVCGENPKITTLIDYEQFCGSRANDKDHKLQLLDARDRITPLEYRRFLNEGKPHILVDVRPPMEYEICHLDNAINIPLDTLNNETVLCDIKQHIDAKRNKSSSLPVIVVCRRGNASQKGVIKLKEHLTEEAVTIRDIIGGLHGWANDVDKLFPVY